MQPAKILCLSGSIRSGSVNVRLLGSAIKELSKHDCEITRVSLEDYPLPIYNGDLEAGEGVPKNAVKLAQLMAAHDGYFFTCSEYNGSLTPLMKNTIDWLTRVPSEKASPFKNKIAAISCCSPGGGGGMTMLYHMRDILVRLGVLVVSEQVAVGNSGKAFDDMDQLTDDRTRTFLESACRSLATKAVLLRAE